MRLFFALWPDDRVRQLLADAAAALPRGVGRAVVPANYHITLEFVGQADPAAYECLEAAAEGISIEPFQLTLGRFGYWQQPRTLWFGPHHLPPELLGLAYKLRDITGQCGLQPDTRPYRPHVTLVRKVARQPRWPAVQPVEWQVEDFVLCQSITTPKGPVYEVLKRWPLGTGTAPR